MIVIVGYLRRNQKWAALLAVGRPRCASARESSTVMQVGRLYVGRLKASSVKEIKYIIARQSDMWTLNGSPVPGLDRFVDLDLGFMPATNLQQLRRVPIAGNESAQVPVAWLDIETGMLIELSQPYERRSTTAFWYEAPSVGYKGLLEWRQTDLSDITRVSGKPRLRLKWPRANPYVQGPTPEPNKA